MNVSLSAIRIAALGVAAGISFAATQATADELWDHQQEIEAQQAEQRRVEETGRQMANDVAAMQANEPPPPEYVPNTMVSFPPDAWNNWVKRNQELHQQDLEEKFGNDPAYQDLMKGIWTYYASPAGQNPKSCAATFWTRNGGVTFVHFAGLQGVEDSTYLGFFGNGIPTVDQPRTVTMDLIQSGETQQVQVYNINFALVKSMGMVLFHIDSPAILIGAIEDQQDFELKFNGASIAQGVWHNGIQARNHMASCLQSQGYLSR